MSEARKAPMRSFRCPGRAVLVASSFVVKAVLRTSCRRFVARRFPEWLQPEPVPVESWNEFLGQLHDRQPSVLKGYGSDVAEKWNFEYLERQMSGSNWRVHLVPKENQRFQRVYGQGIGEGLVSLMSFPEFAKKSLAADSQHSYYMQVPYTGRPLQELGEDPYGAEMRQDRESFQWLWDVAAKAALGELDNNQLWIGRGGNLTPCHYDKAENLHIQISGRKHFLLIPPEETFAVYPYPIHHPLDSFSMVDFDRPDLQRFDRFARLQCFEATLEPGGLLYLPKYWWHQVTQSSGDNISLNFWCAEPPADQMSIFQQNPRCRALLAHRFLEDFTGGLVERLREVSALPSSFSTARLLTELADDWAEDTPPALRRLGDTVKGRLAELMGGLSPEELQELLEGTCAGQRLFAPVPETEVTTASQGDLGGWLPTQ
ncbi:Hypoxia-inducible factor 1-alpha inhibitor (Hypoxia-inducible factor asparagine hydroxylase) [Durusdinium trenchii]